MTEHNYKRGNLYLQSEFLSYRQGMDPLTLPRQGFLNPKSSFFLSMRDIWRIVPFYDYFFTCDVTDEVVIEIFEQFDNDFFGL